MARIAGYRQKHNVNGEMVEVGNLTIDGIYLGIRIKRSSRTKNSATYLKIRSFLEELRDKRDRETLEAIRDNPKVPLDAVRRWYHSKGELPKPWDASSYNLDERLHAWIESEDKITERTKKSYRWNIERFLRSVSSGKNIVADTPRLLARYKTETQDKKVLFNRSRATILSFLNRELTTSHPVYEEAKAVTAWRKKDILRKRIGKHLTPVQIDNAFNKDPKNPLKSLIYFLCTTGMRPEEFCVHGFTVHKDKGCIHIHGKKTVNSNRVVPLIFTEFIPDNETLGYNHDTLNLAIKRYLPENTTQDCRRSFFSWCQKAGYEPNHITYYYGHSKSQTEEYGQQEAERYWVKGDAMKMIEWLKTERLNLPLPDPNLLNYPKTIDDLSTSTASLTKRDIINHLNEYLAANHPSVFRRLYKVTELELA